MSELMEMYIKDLEGFAEGECFGYAAVISLDLTKRKVNRTKPHVTLVYGQNLEDAIAEYKQRDESSGLFDDDFKPEMITILFQAEF
ncbi:MAG: hypothetical protein HRT95_05755 [Moritella sp.]|uniref:hypothetical protein n=1 Tax=Moritella sp. TaxID=78556 RepID=UPI001DC88C50|nr:hypothetical protein [Moritella sp.]NQZ49696.1 hypothetical protein [Moritella sp.]